MKKISLSIIGIIGILVLVVFASGCTSSDTGNNSTQQSTSTSEGSSGSSSSSSSSSSSNVDVSIISSSAWSGAISDSTGTRSIQGTGSQTIALGSVTGAVAANAQKEGNDTGTLTVSITSGGKTLATQSTSAAYGVVQVSGSV